MHHGERPRARREDDGQRYHQRDDPGRDIQLDDHHPVERADGQRSRHAHRHLEQGETQQARQGQFRGDGIGERQEARIQPAPEGGAQHAQFGDVTAGVAAHVDLVGAVIQIPLARSHF